MLGRRQFRIKVFQALYAWFEGGETRQDVAEKQLLQSIEKFYELYFYLLSFFLEVIDFYRRRTEDARHKFYPTEEEKNPNLKLIENSVIQIFQQNKSLEHKIVTYKISWTEDQEMIRGIFNKIKAGKEYSEYLNSGNKSFDEDREIVFRLFKKYIARSAALQSYFEEKNIYWADDFDAACVFVLKTIRLIREDHSPENSFPELFKKMDGDDPEDDRRFIVNLFRFTIGQSEKLEKMIEGKTHNWELDRIALSDIILIKMALVELIHFPSIPVKVTLNEYIDLSKMFSTPKSKLFINGILDKMVEELNVDKKIRKTGRGLV
ncbi:MAG: transcription antitermination factor NusB [Bacteroidota bacterium]|nr:transcription antitermination factor NusB [Bacteroidota bacterium]